MKTKMTKMLSCCFLVAGGLMMAGCSTDDGIDVGEVDTLLGVGTNGFTIPGGGSDPPVTCRTRLPAWEGTEPFWTPAPPGKKPVSVPPSG